MNFKFTLSLFGLSFLLCGCGEIQQVLENSCNIAAKYGVIRPITYPVPECGMCRNNREILDNILDKLIDDTRINSDREVKIYKTLYIDDEGVETATQTDAVTLPVLED